MAKTRRDGSFLTPDDAGYGNRPYVYCEFPKRLFRWHRADRRGRTACVGTRHGAGAGDACWSLEHVTVQSAVEAAEAGRAGWADLASTIDRM